MGTSLLFLTPLAGMWIAVRMVLPLAPESVLNVLGLLALATTVYAAAMTLIQTDTRKFLGYLLLSFSAQVVVGLASASPIGVTGSLCVWLSTSLALAGLGLTLRALESRCGRVSLAECHGFFAHTPNLATFFILTGLACVGFPGTFGFVGTELLVDGVVEAYPHIGIALVIAAAFSGIALVRAYFRIFTGTQYASSVSLKVRTGERYAVLSVAALILIGGLVPQFNITARHEAAVELLARRDAMLNETAPSAVAAAPDRRP